MNRQSTTVAMMGIVNVTPDSFSDGGRFLAPDSAVEHGLRLVREGAQWLDVGGESTRPGAEPVSEDEELRRVVPVVRRLRQAGTRFISVDTTKPQVAADALAAGASLINDVSGLSDPDMVRVAAKVHAHVCIMHRQGMPATMQLAPTYDDVVEDVANWLEARVASSGLPKERLLVDPGIGFGKTSEQNQALLRGLGRLRRIGCRVLIGLSRKSFIGAVLGGRPPEERVVASAAAVAVLASRGLIDVVRVHDVQATADALAIAQAL